MAEEVISIISKFAWVVYASGIVQGMRFGGIIRKTKQNFDEINEEEQVVNKYQKMFDFTGKCAVVVGGGGGIGGGIAEGFAAVGMRVAIVGRTLSKLEAKAKSIEAETGNPVFCFAADCNDPVAVEKLAGDVVATLGGVDVLVNSQGVNKKFSALEHPVAEWDEMFAANVKSVMLTCQFFGRHMVAQKSGRIINVSSVGSVRTKPSDISVCYGASKGAVDAYSLNLAAGWGMHNITVNCIAPIMTETEMMKPIFEKMPELRDGTAARVPMGRIGLPEDCAGLALFLASDAAAFVSGQRFYPDGGLLTLQ